MDKQPISNWFVLFPFGTVIALFQIRTSGSPWKKSEVSAAVLAPNLIRETILSTPPRVTPVLSGREFKRCERLA